MDLKIFSAAAPAPLMRDAFVGVMHDLATLVDSAGPGPTDLSGLGNCDHTSLIKKKVRVVLVTGDMCCL